MLNIGDKAPDFRLTDSHGTEIKLSDFSGYRIVLYFYPKDNTSGCTLEAKEFTELLPEFKKENTVVLGVSPDSPASHLKFEEKQGLKIILLSDQDKEVLNQFGVWQLKKMCGKEHMGVVRTTYVIENDGKISHIFNKVKAAGHAAEVLRTIKV